MMPDSIFLLNTHPSPFWFKEKQIPNMTEYTRKRPEEEWTNEERDGELLIRFAFYMYKDEPDVLYLSNVFVEEGSRNHGFGTRILRAAEKVAETIGATTISLKVKQDSPANAWYRKNGYGYVAFEDGYDWLEKNLEYMKPKKQEWSEEDREMIDHLIEALPMWANGRIAMLPSQADEYVERLKSLCPQPKQEWSEKDEKMRERLITRLNWITYNTRTDGTSPNITFFDEIDWLKSLRPQPHWKPSKEEIDAFENLLKGEFPNKIFPGTTLANLLNKLKKLYYNEAIQVWKPSEEQN